MCVGPQVGMREILVEAGGEQVQRTGESKPLCAPHGADVTLEPLTPRGSRAPDALAVPLGRGDVARLELAQHPVEESVEVTRQPANIVQGDVSLLLVGHGPPPPRWRDPKHA
jgi:hypothetical protein